MSTIPPATLPLPPVAPAPLLDRLSTYVQAHKRVILIGATSAVIVAGASYYYLKAAGPPRSGGSEEGAEKKKRSKSKGKAKKATDKLVDTKEDRQSFIPSLCILSNRKTGHFPSNYGRILGIILCPLPRHSNAPDRLEISTDTFPRFQSSRKRNLQQCRLKSVSLLPLLRSHD